MLSLKQGLEPRPLLLIYTSVRVLTWHDVSLHSLLRGGLSRFDYLRCRLIDINVPWLGPKLRLPLRAAQLVCKKDEKYK